ncbi:MAG: hypothetical protein CEE43_13740 [Promethearchaeota archaeon Loki_b32]|nr:MAG: hypothetical protein CEE43_13740 [Candidatus Lokiarchaeota archaeon Loki_b32]
MNSFKKRDYYEVLGIDRNASKTQIKLAYRRLAKKYHPDKNKKDLNAKEKFIEIHEAYKILNDPKRRSQYDHIGLSEPFFGKDFESILSTPDFNDYDFGNNFVYTVLKYFRRK